MGCEWESVSEQVAVVGYSLTQEARAFILGELAYTDMPLEII